MYMLCIIAYMFSCLYISEAPRSNVSTGSLISQPNLNSLWSANFIIQQQPKWNGSIEGNWSSEMGDLPLTAASMVTVFMGRGWFVRGYNRRPGQIWALDDSCLYQFSCLYYVLLQPYLYIKKKMLYSCKLLAYLYFRTYLRFSCNLGSKFCFFLQLNFSSFMMEIGLINFYPIFL